MRRYVWLTASLLLVSSGLRADANTDAFSDGSAFGKGNVSQGTANLKTPDTVTSAIPGYTDKPPQSSHYGGVTGGDGGLANDGQTAIGSNDAGQAIMSSGTTNPRPTLDPNAPFITYGKTTEASAGTIVDGTNTRCSDTSVTKTTFENYTCDRDVAVIQTCNRTASIVVTGSTTTDNTTLVIDPGDSSPVTEASYWVRYDFVMQDSGVISSGTLKMVYPRDPNYHSHDGNRLYYVVQFGSVSVNSLLNETHPINFPPFGVSKGQVVSLRVLYHTDGAQSQYRDSLIKSLSAKGVLTLTLAFAVQRDTTHSALQWNESCGFDKSTATGLKETTCVDPGGDRSVTQNGRTFTEHSDCWQYSDAYATATDSTGTCGTLMSDKNCTRATTACTETESGVCVHQSETWQCQKTFTSGGLLCGNDYFCKSGDCNEANGAGDNGFDDAVTRLAGLAAAGDDTKGDSPNVSAFTGKVMSCRKAAAGFSNCCKDSGWGQSIGLQKCNSDEMALGKAKAKKVTVYVGQKCDHKVLGVCLQKSAVYCAFGGKLARIIQEQGRRDQLGIGFGSGDSPNCGGITVPQLQSIQWDKMNFSEYEDDLRANMKVPDTGALTQQVKDRIAAQVNQLKGTTP